jgi:hypothetical protein
MAAPVREPEPAPMPNVVDELMQSGGISPEAHYFAGKKQFDRLLPGQQPAPYAVSYSKVPR